MSWWLTILIKLAIQFGLPAVESAVSPEVAAIIERILGLISGSPTPALTTKALNTHLDSFLTNVPFTDPPQRI